MVYERGTVLFLLNERFVEYAQQMGWEMLSPRISNVSCLLIDIPSSF